MRLIELKEQQKIEFEILLYLKGICEKNNVEFFLCGGTLLGAIRHKGFIPWDDDIDVFLLRKDYDKLMKILSNIDDSDKYQLLSPEFNGNYYYWFSKLVCKKTELIENNLPRINDLGVYIDIFPIDNLPSAKLEIYKHVKKVIKYNKYLMYSMDTYYYSDNIFKRILKILLLFPVHIFCKIKGTNYWKNKLITLLKKYSKEETEYVGCVASAYSIKDIFPKKIFEKTINVSFENETFMAPYEYETYLKGLYGDYMKLPPTNKRFSHHNFSAYWKE